MDGTATVSRVTCGRRSGGTFSRAEPDLAFPTRRTLETVREARWLLAGNWAAQLTTIPLLQSKSPTCCAGRGGDAMDVETRITELLPRLPAGDDRPARAVFDHYS